MELQTPPQYIPVPPVRRNRDAENLKLLSAFYYVLAGLLAALACWQIIHVSIGIGILAELGPFGDGEAHVDLIGSMLVILGLFCIIFDSALVALLVTAGNCLRNCTRRVFCLVVACLSCAMIPLGTILGVLSIVLLCKPSVKALFASSSAPAAAEAETV